LRRLGFNVWIISTLNKINIKDSLQIVELAEQFGVSLVKFHICTYEGNSKKNSEIILNPDEWIQFIKLISREGKKFKTKILYQPTFANDELGKLYFEEGYTGCLAKRLCKVSVFPDGRIYLCSCLFDTNLNFAEMIDNKIKLNRKASELSLFINNDIKGKCNNCLFLKHCQGGCPAEKAIWGFTTCENNTELFSICRLWKSNI
jgi:radical SAM protein with 4Fe4S-binding SPASM domain